MNIEEVRRKARDYARINQVHKRSYKKKRDKLFEMYGSTCKCCGESIRDFLTLEHIHGQRGIKRLDSMSALRQATKEYRPDLFEILCWNCNCAKGKLGYCPHTLLTK